MKFVESVYLKSGRVNNKRHDSMEFLELVSSRLGLSVDILKKPRGRIQKSVCHKAIVILQNEYDMEIRETARILNMSPSTVSHILKSNNRTLTGLLLFKTMKKSRGMMEGCGKTSTPAP